MTDRMTKLVLLLCCVVSVGAHAQSADAIQKRLEQEAAELRPWTADKVLQQAVAKQNALALTAAEVQRRESAWMNDAALVAGVTTGPCADQLRALQAKAPKYGEILLMDNQGALVCATNRTSDYWQGDEPKWARASAGEGSVFIDRPRLDDSAKERLAQVSLPMTAGGKVVGVLTVGIKLDALLKK
jgi:hypothetical protein